MRILEYRGNAGRAVLSAVDSIQMTPSTSLKRSLFSTLVSPKPWFLHYRMPSTSSCAPMSQTSNYRHGSRSRTCSLGYVAVGSWLFPRWSIDVVVMGFCQRRSRLWLCRQRLRFQRARRPWEPCGKPTELRSSSCSRVWCVLMMEWNMTNSRQLCAWP